MRLEIADQTLTMLRQDLQLTTSATAGRGTPPERPEPSPSDDISSLRSRPSARGMRSRIRAPWVTISACCGSIIMKASVIDIDDGRP